MAPIPTRTSARHGDEPVRRAAPSLPRAALALTLGFQVTACSTLTSVKNTFLGGGPARGDAGYVKGFPGLTVADEPQAALVGKDVLAAGGTAADAAVAMAFTLAVTLPSRAGLGGGGACVAYTIAPASPANGVPEAIMFVPPPVQSVGGGDRPAAVPSLPRGMYLLHARHGLLPLDSLIERAEKIARAGTTVSRAFAHDLGLVAGPLLADPGARAAFGPAGSPLVEGQGMIQPDLASTMAQMRVAGIGDLYQGTLARKTEAQSALAGTPIGLVDLKADLPSFVVPATITEGDIQVAFAPTSGGVGAAAALRALQVRPNDNQAAFNRSIAAATRWRQGGVTVDQMVNGDLPAPAAMPNYPASTTFGVADAAGNAVICALSMNNLFGTGRMVPGLGFLTAASPASVPEPLLAAALAWSPRKESFRGMAGGSGQGGASLAAAVAIANMLRTGQALSAVVPEPGRANTMSCAGYLPGAPETCAAVPDPREYGLATGAR